MPLHFVCEDIAEFESDAIVYAATLSALESGAVSPAPGTEPEEERKILAGLKTGEVCITFAHDLYCTYVIHTVCPVEADGEEKLAECWRSCLQVAVDHDCRSVAFPLISAGPFGFAETAAAAVAVETVRAFLQDHPMEVELVFSQEESFRRCAALYPELVG